MSGTIACRCSVLSSGPASMFAIMNRTHVLPDFGYELNQVIAMPLPYRGAPPAAPSVRNLDAGRPQRYHSKTFSNN